MQASIHVQEWGVQEWGYRHQVHLDNGDTHSNHRADKTQVIVLAKQPTVLSLLSCVSMQMSYTINKKLLLSTVKLHNRLFRKTKNSNQCIVRAMHRVNQ